MLFNFLIFNVFVFLFYYFNFLTIIINLNLIYCVFFFYFMNYFFLKNLNATNPDLDLFLKYIKFFTKHFFNLLNLSSSLFKKIYNFIYIKSFVFLKSCFNFLNLYFKNIFIIWRPLFKKWSYFGYFRTNRSKWIK